ncbi:DUF6476 family protein [Ostreiculturibacter nitratireducens]|uniref:DUF6476 family protein n=1 Tax=Ostreiculturibacter nitratireducens TaxID=3075226 RepID=UPI0031B5C0D9
MSDTDDPQQEPELPPDLRFLKILVATLAGTMILGLIAIVTLIVIRFPAAMEARPELPAEITLPEGETASAVTFGKGWYAVVTGEGDEILIFDARTGALRQRVPVGN